MMLFNGYAITGRGRRSNRPSLRELNNHVVEAVAIKWKDLGFQLLNNVLAQHILEIVEADHKGEVSILRSSLREPRHPLQYLAMY